MGSPVPDPKIGETFQRWTVTGATVTVGRYKRVPVTCSCGTAKVIDKSNLLKGLSQSCGCLSKEVVSARSKTHGKAKTPVYAVWNMMKQRCLLPTNKQYPDYGGRGITVCDEWLVFENFYADMGDPPFKGASIEREDTSKGYSKENCVWASRAQQNRNTRKTVLYTFQGSARTLREVSELVGMNLNTLSSRIYGQGMSLEEAIAKPIMASTESAKLAGKGRNPGRIDGYKKYSQGN